MKPFWYHRPAENFPPPTIRHSDEIPAGDRLSIKCTQLNLPAKEQKELIRSWSNAFPQLHGVRWLWLKSRVSQELFDAACSIPNLEGLWIKWGAMKSISSLRKQPNIKSLHLGNSSSVESIDELSEMHGLRWLDLEHMPHVSSLDPLKPLTSLMGLTVQGSMFVTQKIQTLEPLRGMHDLKYLSLANLKASDNSLAALSEMPSLERLIIGSGWNPADVESLRRNKPHLKIN